MFDLLGWFRNAVKPPDIPPRGLGAALEESAERVQQAARQQRTAADRLMSTIEETVITVHKKNYQ